MANRSGKGELVSMAPASLVNPGISINLAGAFLSGRHPRTLLAYRNLD